MFAIGAVIFCAMGGWQIERAYYKERLVAAEQAAQAAGTQTIPSRGDAGVPDLVQGREYIAAGRFDTRHQILLADQLRGTQSGYHVWTPLVLDNGARVMVDRGWVERPPRGEALPNPTATNDAVRVKGIWAGFPQPALQWGAASACDTQGWPRALSYPDVAGIRCQYDAPVLDGLLLLDPQDANGFVREWDEDRDPIGLRPLGHYAYASQWFLMAIVAGVILVVVNLRRR